MYKKGVRDEKNIIYLSCTGNCISYRNPKRAGIQLVKLSLLYTIPWLGIRFMGLEPLGFWQAQMLAALMMLLSNALPNVAGMGSIETAFLLVFQSFLGASGAMSALVLYRLASYYFTFVLSAVAFFLIQHRLGAEPQDKA